MARRRYTKAEKAHAVGIAEAAGTQAAGEQLGIPPTTIAYWLDAPEFVALRQNTRAEVSERFWAAIQIGLHEVAKGLRDPEAPLRDKSVALGILYDKHALMTGEATSRSESKSITDDLPDHERQRLRDWIDSLPATPSPEGAPV